MKGQKTKPLTKPKTAAKRVRRKRKKRKVNVDDIQENRQEAEAIKDLLEKDFEIDIQPSNNPMNTLFPQQSNRMLWLGITKSEQKKQDKRLRETARREDRVSEEVSESPDKLKISKIDDSGGWKGGFEVKKTKVFSHSRLNRIIRPKKGNSRVTEGCVDPKKNRKFYTQANLKYPFFNTRDPENFDSTSMSYEKSKTMSNFPTKNPKNFFKILRHKEPSSLISKSKGPENSSDSDRNSSISYKLWSINKRKYFKEEKNQFREYRKVGSRNHNWDNSRLEKMIIEDIMESSFKTQNKKKSKSTKKMPKFKKLKKKNSLVNYLRQKKTEDIQKSYDQRMKGIEIHQSFKQEMEKLKNRRKMYRVKNAFIANDNKLYKLEKEKSLKSKIKEIGETEMKNGFKKFTLKELLSESCEGKPEVPGKRTSYFLNPTLSLKPNFGMENTGHFTASKAKYEYKNLELIDPGYKRRRTLSNQVFKKVRSKTLKMEKMERTDKNKPRMDRRRSFHRPHSSFVANNPRLNYKIVQNEVLKENVSKNNNNQRKMVSTKKIKNRNPGANRDKILDQIIVGKRRNESIKKHFERNFGILGTNKRLLGVLHRREASGGTRKGVLERRARIRSNGLNDKILNK